MRGINTLSVAQMCWWWCLIFKNSPTLLNHLSPGTIHRGFWQNQQLPQTTRWWLWLWVHVTSVQGGNKHTYPHTDSTHTQTGPRDVTSYLHTLNTLPHAYTQQHRQHTTPHHTHTVFRDMGPVLTAAKLTWHWSDWSDPRKAKRTHERAGAFVFVECHTSSRGKPITGPGRPLKLWEGCVGIASVATSDVNSNILIAGYFLD